MQIIIVINQLEVTALHGIASAILAKIYEANTFPTLAVAFKIPDTVPILPYLSKCNAINDCPNGAAP